MERSIEILRDGPVLLLSGDVDVRSTPEVRTAIYDHLEQFGHADVVLDLTDVASIDRTALNVLAVATRRAAHEGHHLTLRGCSPAVRRMLHLTHLIRFVEVERSDRRVG